jgi:hypothetical protein
MPREIQTMRSEELIMALRGVLTGHPEVELALLLDSPARGHMGGDFDVLVEGDGVDREQAAPRR